MRSILFLSVFGAFVVTNASPDSRSAASVAPPAMKVYDQDNNRPRTHLSSAFARELDASSPHLAHSIHRDDSPNFGHRTSRKRLSTLLKPSLLDSESFAPSLPPIPIKRGVLPLVVPSSPEPAGDSPSAPAKPAAPSSAPQAPPHDAPSAAKAPGAASAPSPSTPTTPAKRDEPPIHAHPSPESPSSEPTKSERPPSASPPSAPESLAILPRDSQVDKPINSHSIAGGAGNSFWKRQIRNADYSSNNKPSNSSTASGHDDASKEDKTASPPSQTDSPKKRDVELDQVAAHRRLPRAAAKRRLRTMQTAPVRPGNSIRDVEDGSLRPIAELSARALYD
ncbi:hypothetical protein VKT23_001276 [Stygiomarasmius scandens]|uniref:Uncharacterized protein n=1 Tax=Marasmiellus scandens TaxID=2682957 RepID=A0ABR1KAG9_9AGAR